MAICANLRRWRWPLLAITVLIVGSFFLTLPARSSDKEDAARSLVAWIVDDRAVSGHEKKYPDAKWMPKQKRFFVVCDFLPADVSLSDDPRVQRITSQEYEAVYKKYRFDDTDYIHLELKSDSESELVVEISNTFGSMAGHGYRFEFHRTVWGLRASGKFLWVS